MANKFTVIEDAGHYPVHLQTFSNGTLMLVGDRSGKPDLNKIFPMSESQLLALANKVRENK